MKSLSLFQPLMPVEHACELGGEQGRPMGDIVRFSDAVATPAIAATDMIMAVSELKTTFFTKSNHGIPTPVVSKKIPIHNNYRLEISHLK